MEAHLGEMQTHLDGAWDALETAQVKLESARNDVRQTVQDFPLAFRGIVREKKHVFDNLKSQGIEQKAAAFFCESAQEDKQKRQKKKQRKQSDTSHLPIYPCNPH